MSLITFVLVDVNFQTNYSTSFLNDTLWNFIAAYNFIGLEINYPNGRRLNLDGSVYKMWNRIEIVFNLGFGFG